jgi:carboxypeptidase C (cathepsin A)
LTWFYASDWICNVAGVEAVVSQLTFPQSAELSATSLTNYTVKGEVVGEFKTAGKFSFLEVFDAGHEVPAYQPAAALQVFNQTMNLQALYST